MSKDLVSIFDYLEKEKGIKRELIICAIQESLQAAAQKSVGGSANVTVKIDPRTANIEVYCEKEIVEEVEVPAQEISLENAKLFDPDCELGQFIDILVTPKDFGRIAAQKARQVISQKLRGAERDVIFEEYRDRLHELVSGTVKRFVKGRRMMIDLGKVEAVMPLQNFPKTEFYNIGDKVYALILEVVDTENGGAEVVLSRSHPEFVRQLFIQEVPEIHDGVIEIMNIVRDPGYRTKITVKANDMKIDPVGACVGMRGMRVKNIVRELNNEKIDIIPYSSDPVQLLQNALAPIEIDKISVNSDDNEISIVIEDESYPMVIGKRGMNAQLNGELIGYRLDVKRKSEYERHKQLQRLEMGESEDPSLDLPLKPMTGLNKLIFDQLMEEGFNTPRALLRATSQQLEKIGINSERVDEILEQIRKERT